MDERPRKRQRTCCAAAGCTTLPSYGMARDKGGGRFCAEHKAAGMVDLKHKRCAAAGCTSRPSYGLPDDGKATLCAEHKAAGMVDVLNKRCAAAGCTSRPSFGLPDDGKGRFCAEQEQKMRGRGVRVFESCI